MFAGIIPLIQRKDIIIQSRKKNAREKSYTDMILQKDLDSDRGSKTSTFQKDLKGEGSNKVIRPAGQPIEANITYLLLVAGNIFAFGLFVSPIPTVRRIIRNQRTEQFSGLPYIYALSWYGSPLVSSDNLLVTTVNSVGAVFQIVYIIIFITYAEKGKKLRMVGLLLAVFGLFVVILVGSLLIVDFEVRHLTIGFLSCASLISMFASPLLVINLVIRTRSVEFMPFYLSLSTFLMSTSFCLYGIFNFDPFVYAPNGIGTLLGIIQLSLYSYYITAVGEDSREPLIESFS